MGCSFIHSLLVKLTYRSRTSDSLGYTIQTSRNLITVCWCFDDDYSVWWYIPCFLFCIVLIRHLEWNTLLLICLSLASPHHLPLSDCLHISWAVTADWYCIVLFVVLSGQKTWCRTSGTTYTSEMLRSRPPLACLSPYLTDWKQSLSGGTRLIFEPLAKILCRTIWLTISTITPPSGPVIGQLMLSI